jgi:hypothetical protein
MPTGRTAPARCSRIRCGCRPGRRPAGRPDRMDRTSAPEPVPPSKPSRSSKSPKPESASELAPKVARSGPGSDFQPGFQIASKQALLSRSIHVRALGRARCRSGSLGLRWPRPARAERSRTSFGRSRTPRESRSVQLFNLPSTMFGYLGFMGTRLDDSKKTPVRALQRRHALLAAYLNIVDRLDGPSRRHAGEFRQHRPRRDIATCRVRSLSRMAGRMGGPFLAGRGPFQAG